MPELDDTLVLRSMCKNVQPFRRVICFAVPMHRIKPYIEAMLYQFPTATAYKYVNFSRENPANGSQQSICRFRGRAASAAFDFSRQHDELGWPTRLHAHSRSRGGFHLLLTLWALPGDLASNRSVCILQHPNFDGTFAHHHPGRLNHPVPHGSGQDFPSNPVIPGAFLTGYNGESFGSSVVECVFSSRYWRL